jgi:hypothetical protein
VYTRGARERLTHTHGVDVCNGTMKSAGCLGALLLYLSRRLLSLAWRCFAFLCHYIQRARVGGRRLCGDSAPEIDPACTLNSFAPFAMNLLQVSRRQKMLSLHPPGMGRKLCALHSPAAVIIWCSAVRMRNDLDVSHHSRKLGQASHLHRCQTRSEILLPGLTFCCINILPKFIMPDIYFYRRA